MSTVTSETVRAEYSSGTGWEAGNIAPATKWIDESGNVVDSEPTGIGRVLIAQGDVVRPYMVDVLKGTTSVDLDPRVDNEHSPGDASHGNQTPAVTGREPLDADDDAPAAPDYSKMNKGPLQDAIDARNAPRPDDQKLDREGTKAELAARLKADDDARAGGDSA